MRLTAPFAVALCALLAVGCWVVPAPADDTPERSLAEQIEGDRYLPIGLTPEEEGMLHLIGRDHRSTPRRPGPSATRASSSP